MERAIKRWSVFCIVWSALVGGALLLLNLFIRGMLRGQMLGGGTGWQAFLAWCGGIEAVNLLALWGAVRLRAWACVVLTALLAGCGIAFFFLAPETRDKALFGPLLWLAPSLVPTILLWRRWPRLHRGF